MDYKVSYRKKDGGIQCIINYKAGNKWKQKSKQGFKTQKEARPWYKAQIEELSKLNLNANIDYHDLTLQELTNIFIDSVKNKYAHSTLEKYRIIQIHFKSIMNKKINNITTFEIQQIVDNMEVAPSSKAAYLKNLKSLFNFAIDKLEVLGRNPANKVEIEKVKKRAYVVITKEEFYQDIYPNLAKRKDVQLIYKIAFSTGLRAGEILGLTYDCIKKDYLIINKQWNYTGPGIIELKKLKTTNSERDVPISADLYNDIINFKNNNLHISGRLFHMVRSKSTINNFYNTNFKDTKYANLRLHDMRHSFVSILIEQGLDFKIIADLVGDSLATVISTYSHVNNDSKLKARELIENVF